MAARRTTGHSRNLRELERDWDWNNRGEEGAKDQTKTLRDGNRILGPRACVAQTRSVCNGQLKGKTLQSQLSRKVNNRDRVRAAECKLWGVGCGVWGAGVEGYGSQPGWSSEEW